MPNVPGDDEPLLRAIAALRIDVNRWIDEQLASVRDRVEVPAPARPSRPAAVLTATEPPDEVAKVREIDPRQRLEALARHLDHRLRLANLPAAERKDRGTVGDP